MQKGLFILLCLFSFSLAAAANTQLAVISLQHKMGNELIETIQPFLMPEEVITAKGKKLIIRSSPHTLKQIQQLVKQLDQPAPRLLIEVQQPVTGSKQYEQLKLSLHSNDNAQLRRYRSHDRDSAINSQQLQLLDGQSAFISTGQLVPMASKQVGGNGRARTVIEHKKINSGFQVIAHLEGDKVNLKIAPFTSSLTSQGGHIEQQQLFTNIRVPLGQWVKIAGQANQKPTSSINHYLSHSRTNTERSIFLRVTILVN